MSMDTYAPYNFIPLENRVLSYTDDKNNKTLSQSRFDQDKLTGTILYQVETITPLHISDGQGHIFKNPEGIPTIPGNTIRGLTRFNASIFSYASMVNKAIEKKDVRDQKFYYRQFASTDVTAKKHYANVTGLKPKVDGKYRYSILENVHAGYMRKEGTGYAITPAEKLSRGSESSENTKKYSYLPIHEHELRSRDIRGVNFMYSNNMRREDYKDLGKLRREENSSYRPYVCKVNYTVSNGKAVVDNNGPYHGMMTSSNHMFKKKHHYLIYKENTDAESIKISKEQAELYIQDLAYTKKLTENTMEIQHDFAYYQLPKEGETKPVFYILGEEGDQGQLIFGFTPYLRLPAIGSIYDGLPNAHTSFEGIDWTDAMFGWMDYRSKVSFRDLKVASNYKETSQNYIMVLGEPKASWYKAYVHQNDEYTLASYNTKDFKIRGRKYYWIKNELDTEAITKSAEKQDITSKLTTSIRGIDEGAIFKGEVRFENLSRIEVGLLIYALKQGDTDGFMNIGKGKPYGFGKCKLVIDEVRIENLSKKYKSFGADYIEKINPDLVIEDFKNYVLEMTGVEKLENLNAYKDFQLSRKPLNKIKCRYLPLEAFSKSTALPTPEQVISGKVTVPQQKNTARPTKNHSSNHKTGTSNNKQRDNKQNSVSPNNPFAKFKDEFK